jgi:sugar/nucleoside kinase (ribokinase family)
MRIITIGSALVDIFIRSEHFSKDTHGVVRVGEVGGKFDVSSFILKTGGGAGNVATGFARLGFDSAVISETGQDELARMVMEDLEKEKVDTSLMIHEKKEETGGSVILVLADGSRAALVHRGASSLLDPKDIDIKELSHANWVHISSLSGRLDTLKHVFSVLKFHGVKTSWNPGSSDLKLIKEGKLEVEDICAQVLILNKQEWEMIDGHQTKLKKCIKQIVVTDSVRGGKVFLENGQKIDYKAKETKSVDNTGAGDAFAVGYVASILRGDSIERATYCGAKNSASVVKHFGAKQGLKKRL